MLFKLTALFVTVLASAGLVMLLNNCSFNMLSQFVMISQTLKAHPSESRNEVESILILFMVQLMILLFFVLLMMTIFFFMVLFSVMVETILMERKLIIVVKRVTFLIFPF